MNAVSHPEAVLFRAESDEQLVVRAKDGDDEALTALIQRYAPFVRMRAGAYGVKELDADDLYQEGMIALLTAVRNYCAGLNSSFRTFASVCINNKLNSALRAHMREKNAPMRGYLSLSEPEVPEEALTAHTLDPEQLVIQSEETDARNRRIETLLSLFERQVLKLYLSSYSYEEMSKQLGSSTKAVDNALQRVRRKLRTVFTLE
ncbi:sigma-70 family RNA polymerase sigma factor [Anaerotruncus sp. 1XD42-93]|uniref:sigma-70 family RNA polymerase sigma factor n=1 Tax=Anaerotruncus sp. 1XD42-93 TaxID=2320853 RepID=UPI000EA3CD8B|nr:sigma-70 family RNA polymerase sigma factor [Anaerotruncus sp. 1XD42-93]MCI9160513.1 sigma-70 family RNA polymerase sigma factor [Anaerotruncus sp.]NBK17381.1 sigma-70 family RNA polymerase sigma factor [Anaerotruncus sp. 1XD42-93]NCE74314.1 sigma-70 family RNA polymerase sigma factor [Anaerotruncus sp. X29]RKJ95985.1 sigma-70 family RNA polymerase sigma factor [Anaerotruncus sp. 1XD22-93]